MSEAQYHQRLRFFAGRTPSFVPVSFQASNECTESFSLWRKKYYLSNLVDEPAFRTNLITAFPSLQSKSKENKGMHIKEIQDFHKFFEVVHNPLNVEKIVKEAALVLKQKVLEKVSKIKFSLYINNAQDKYKMALAFHCIKFPPLPSAYFTLSFEPDSPS